MNPQSILAAVVAVSAAGVASAGVRTFDYSGVDWNDPANYDDFDNVRYVVTETFSLGAIDSIDSVTIELAHTLLSDFDFALIAPTGERFYLAEGNNFFDDGIYDALRDEDVVGDPFNTDPTMRLGQFTFAQAGLVWNDGIEDQIGPIDGGTFAAVEWHDGGFEAGDWTLTVIDSYGSFDFGILGSVSVNYTVPAPGTVGLLATAALAGVRRRRYVHTDVRVVGIDARQS